MFLAGCSGGERKPDRPPSNAEELAEKCLSGWTGDHRGFVDEVKTVLRHPDSMDVHGTYFNANDSLDDGRIRLRMDYSAENAFGGMDRLNALADLNLTCGVTVVQYG